MLLSLTSLHNYDKLCTLDCVSIEENWLGLQGILKMIKHKY